MPNPISPEEQREMAAIRRDSLSGLLVTVAQLVRRIEQLEARIAKLEAERSGEVH